ncbi:MAG: Fimbriae protein [Glaciihabitans sp.]|nr:Fimbriae protein [Glaciihabitans sp.]
MTGPKAPLAGLARVCPVLVGRDAELALAVRRWDAAREGTGHVLLVSGEAGIGKSRLLSEIVDHVGTARNICALIFPRGAEAAGGVLLDLADDLRRSGLRPAADALRARLVEEPAGTAETTNRRLLVSELSGILADLLAEKPTLLRVEDAHWADELSLDVFERVALAVPRTSSMLVVSYRSDELYPRAPLRRWRARLLEKRQAEEVRLNRLTADNIARMAESITGSTATSLLVESLYERSDGIPLHVEELLAGAMPGEVPETVSESVLCRVAQLNPVTQSVVQAAAAIGRSFGVDLLETIVGEPREVVDASLRELAQSHLVVECPGDNIFDFRHALLRDAIHSDLPPRRRQSLHAAVAEAAISAGFRDSFISDHFELALQPARAYQHAIAAAADAVRLSAHREAAQLYRRAQRTLPRSVDPSDRAALSANLAAELTATDDNEAAATQLVTAIGIYRSLGNEIAASELIPRLMAAEHLLGVSLDARAARAADALARLDSLDCAVPDRVRAGLYAALAAASMLHRPLDDAIDFGERAIALATENDALVERTDIRLTLGSVLVFAGRMDEGWRMLEEAKNASERAGLEAQTAHAYRMIGTSASVLVDYDRAAHWISEGIRYTAGTDRWDDHHHLTAHLGHVQWARGEWGDAELSAGSALANGAGSMTTQITALTVLGYLASGRAQLARGHAYLSDACELGDRMGELQRVLPALWGLAELALHEGDAPGAALLSERAYRESSAVADAAYLFPFVVTGTRALLALHDPVLALDWLDRCSELVRRRNIPGTLASLDHAAGLIQLARGNTGKARAFLESAHNSWTAAGRFWETTASSIDLARCAAGSRRPHDAGLLLQAARTAALATGATLLVAEIDAADQSIRPGRPESILSAREFEVARLVAFGATNREIAQSLTIAPRTASSHIEHILVKLGVARRSEIAAWVSRIDA